MRHQACLLLFNVSQWSINYFTGEHAQTQFWSNYEITKCCGYLECKVCLQTMYLCKFGADGSFEYPKHKLWPRNIKNCQLHTLILRPGYDRCWCLDPDFNVCAINATSLGPANLDDPSKNSEILFCKLFRMHLRICICPPYCCCTIHQV